MVNELKIITMTRLALYDKHEGPADRVANDYFRHDYIYRNNLGTRLAVGLGGLIVLVVYWLQALLVNEVDIFEFNIQEHVTDSVFFLLAILAVYSLIGSIQGTRQYYLVQKRLAQYQAMVRQLERLEERARKSLEEEHGSEQPAHTGSLVRTSPVEHTRIASVEHTRIDPHTRPRPRGGHHGHPPPGNRPPRHPHSNPADRRLRERPIDHTPAPKGRTYPMDYTRMPEGRSYPIDHTRAPEGRAPIDSTSTSERHHPPIDHTRTPEKTPLIDSTRASEPPPQ